MTLPDIDAIETLGGALRDFSPVEDPETERSADDANKAYCDVAMATHTLTRAWARITTHATTPTLAAHDEQWAARTSTVPVVARTGAGVFTVTWPSLVTDELAVTHALNLRDAWAAAHGATAVHVQADVTGPAVVTVRVFDMAGAATDAAGTAVTVFAV